MTIAYIGAGSNLGDRTRHLLHGREELALRGGDVLRTSSLYETEPVGYADQPWFLNQIFVLSTALAPRELLELCLDIERARGRERTFPNAPRPLDLDILLYGEQVIAEPDLIVPHPRLTARRFVLEPLAEVAPRLVLPLAGGGKTVRELLADCADPALVRIFHPGSEP